MAVSPATLEAHEAGTHLYQLLHLLLSGLSPQQEIKKTLSQKWKTKTDFSHWVSQNPKLLQLPAKAVSNAPVYFNLCSPYIRISKSRVRIFVEEIKVIVFIDSDLLHDWQSNWRFGFSHMMLSHESENFVTKIGKTEFSGRKLLHLFLCQYLQKQELHIPPVTSILLSSLHQSY